MASTILFKNLIFIKLFCLSPQNDQVYGSVCGVSFDILFNPIPHGGEGGQILLAFRLFSL